MQAGISWDLVMSQDMPFVEGCYRLAAGEWHVITARKASGRRSVEICGDVQWDSGVTGMTVILPGDARLDAITLLKIMSQQLGVSEWREVRGPDSMILR